MSVVIACTRAEPPDIARNGGFRRGDQRVLGLRHEHHPCREHEARAELVARPGDHRVPGLRLALDQAGRTFGAIEQQDRSARYFATSAATSGAASATPSMIVLASRVSGMLAGSMTSRCACHSAASASASARVGAASVRRAGVRHGAPVEHDLEPPVPLDHLRALVEALAQLRPHGALRRRHRIGSSGSFANMSSKSSRIAFQAWGDTFDRATSRAAVSSQARSRSLCIATCRAMHASACATHNHGNDCRSPDRSKNPLSFNILPMTALLHMETLRDDCGAHP